MARLHEYQGKGLLKEHGIAVPAGRIVRSAAEARQAAEDLGCPVILKVQAWVTGRRDKGGVVIVQTPDEAGATAEQLLSLTFGNFPVSEVLIEELIDIRDELFVSLAIDDAARAPVMLLDFHGGTGIEERAASVVRLAVDVEDGVDQQQMRDAIANSPLDHASHDVVAASLNNIVDIARQKEARSLEVNPLVITTDGKVIAADCRMTIDDYAVFRHPELGIEIARELDHPATPLERQAYAIEQADHRGTFYFAQLPTDQSETTGPLIGFHGAGGGGSMMSMDAVSNAGFTLANFCDTSGNPSAAKVYKAARIIASQPGIVGYFGSGSGVASQEQYHSAYGLAKAFIEINMSVPVVVRLGGNSEDRAVEILEGACRDLPAPVEGYKKDDTPAFCAERFKTLVEQQASRDQGIEGPRVRSVQSPATPVAGTAGGMSQRRMPDFVGSSEALQIPIDGGTLWIDLQECDEQTTELVVNNSSELFKRGSDGKPAPAVDVEEFAKKDSELIMLEIECRRAGKPVVFVDLPIPLLDGEAAEGRAA